MEEIVGETTSLFQENNFGLNPERLKNTQVYALGSDAGSQPMLVAGKLFAVEVNTIQALNGNQSMPETVGSTDLEIEASRADRTTIWTVANDQEVYAYHPLDQTSDSWRYCGGSSDYDAAGILPLETLDGNSGVTIGTKQGTVFIKDNSTGRFRTLIMPDPNIRVDLLEPGVEDGTMIIGEKHTKSKLSIINEDGDSLVTTSAINYTSAIALKESSAVLIGHYISEGLISVYSLKKPEIKNGVMQRNRTIKTSGILGESKGTSYLAVDKKERFVAFASRLSNVVGFI